MPTATAIFEGERDRVLEGCEFRGQGFCGFFVLDCTLLGCISSQEGIIRETV